jgi:hypothetical protein
MDTAKRKKGKGTWATRRLPMKPLLALLLSLFVSHGLASQPAGWQESTLVKIQPSEDRCRTCPGWRSTDYSFMVHGGMIYVGQTNKSLHVTLNKHVRIRFDGDGKVGDSLHLLDEAHNDQKLKIVSIIPP